MPDHSLDTLLIYTSDPLEDCLAANNSAAWRLDQKRASGARYLILARKDPHRGHGHRAGFMIAKITGIVPRIEEGAAADGRLAITFDEYAEIDVRDAWNPANQYPVQYISAASLLAEPPEALDFKPVPAKSLPWSYSRRVQSQPKPSAKRLTIAEAKEGLAANFGCRPSDIEISVRA